MDLVKAYDSEVDGDSTDSDIEEVPAFQAPKEVDVINIDSDTEEEAVVEEENATKNKKESFDSTDPEIEEITLDDSPVKKQSFNLDSNSTETDSSVKKTSVNLDMNDSAGNDSLVNKTSAVPSIQPSNSAKKIDYLNLEDSESDKECENSEKNISNLMDTASVLKDTPCGPEKPMDVSSVPNIEKENVYLPKQLDKSISSNLKTGSNSSRNTPDVIQNSTSHSSAENSRLEVCDKESVEPFPLESNNASETLSCIFREDNRVIEASQKIIVSRIPRQIIQTHNAHTKLITSLSWCIPKFSYLFLSASQDGSIKIWDIYRTNSVQCVKANSGLNVAKWSLDGGQIVAGGFEKKAFVYDVQTGKIICCLYRREEGTMDLDTVDHSQIFYLFIIFLSISFRLIDYNSRLVIYSLWNTFLAQNQAWNNLNQSFLTLD